MTPESRTHNGDPPAVDRSAALALWVGILLAPTAFLVDLGARFALVEWACRNDTGFVLWLVAVVATVLALGGGLRAWKNWKLFSRDAAMESEARQPSSLQSTGHALHDDLRTDEGGKVGRGRFMALAGIAASAFFLAVILASFIPSLLLDPCM
jgi:hypothetical protein